MQSPLISIITASYNYEQYIAAAIESVLNQTYTNWELIIIDDGSKDNSVNIIKEYCMHEERIKLFQHENGENKGLAETLKLGIQKSQSEWVAFLEADDTITPDYLEKKLNIIKLYPDVDFIFNDINIVTSIRKVKKSYEKYSRKQKKHILKQNYPCKLIEIERNKKYNNFIATFSAVMLKKELLTNINFNSPVKQWLDFYIWIQIAKNATCFYIDEKLTNWVRHYDSYVTTSIAPRDMLVFYLNILKYWEFELNIIPKILKSMRRMIFRFSLQKRIISVFSREYKF